MVFRSGTERFLYCAAVGALIGLAAPPALAQSAPGSLEMKLLELEQALERQRLEIQILRDELLQLQRGRGPVDTTVRQAQQSAPAAPQPQQAPQQPVGQPPEQRPPRPEVQAIPELGGVLTPKGTLVLEPSIQYSHSQVNRFTFLGGEILAT